MIFDHIAEVARELIDAGNKRFFEEYQAMTPLHRKTGENFIKEKIPELFKSGVLRQLGTTDLSIDSNVSKQITAFIEDAEVKKNHKVLMLLIETFCNSLLNYVAGLSKLMTDYSPIDYLNGNHESTMVIILPDFKCDWQHDHMRNCFENGINNFTNNIYFVDIKHTIGKYKIQNYILNRTLFYRAKQSGKLKIGISPLTCNPAITKDTIETEERNGVGYFSVKEVKDSESINEALISILKKARREMVDILVFPEMLGTEETKKRFDDFCEEQLYDTDLSNPDIVVLPTIWKDHHNQAYVYIGELNKPIIQEKYNRYPYASDGTCRLEDLAIPDVPIINVFHSEHLGRIVVAICKDLLMKEHIEFLIGDLRASLILVPSFSTGDYPFKMISYYGFPYDCHIVWINTCAAEHILPEGSKPLETVGMIYNPSRTSDDDQDKMPTLKKDKCTRQCTECLRIYEAKLKGEKL